MRFFLIISFMVLFITTSQATDNEVEITNDKEVGNIISQFDIKPEEYKITGPLEIITDGETLKFYIYPKEYSLLIKNVKILGKIPSEGIFKGYILEKKDKKGIIIIPTGDLENEKANI